MFFPLSFLFFKTFFSNTLFSRFFHDKIFTHIFFVIFKKAFVKFLQNFSVQYFHTVSFRFSEFVFTKVCFARIFFPGNFIFLFHHLKRRDGGARADCVSGDDAVGNRPDQGFRVPAPLNFFSSNYTYVGDNHNARTLISIDTCMQTLYL